MLLVYFVPMTVLLPPLLHLHAKMVKLKVVLLTVARELKFVPIIDGENVLTMQGMGVQQQQPVLILSASAQVVIVLR